MSLAAQGTLASKLTYTKHPGFHRAGVIPTHVDAKSLPQLYHRWRYSDGIQYWNSLTPVQKAAYHTQAVRKGIPDMAYFLSIYLKEPLDLKFYATLDTWHAITIPDDSPWGNDGTNFGSIRTIGRIDGARYFDGIDDRISFGDKAPFKDITDYLTFGCFIYPDGHQNASASPFGKYLQWLFRWTADDQAYFVIWLTDSDYVTSPIPVSVNAPHLIAATYNLVTKQIIFYCDDQASAPVVTSGNPIKTDGGNPLLIGSYNLEALRFFKGYIDDNFVFNRDFIPQQVLSRSLRQYPV